jgi:hypothetical protein
MTTCRRCELCADGLIITISEAVADGSKLFRIVAILVGKGMVEMSGDEASTGNGASEMRSGVGLAEETSCGGMRPVGVVSED